MGDNFESQNSYNFIFCNHICSFLYYLISNENVNLRKYIDEIIPKSVKDQYILDYLIEKGLIIKKKDVLKCTTFGELIIKLYLYPSSGVKIREILEADYYNVKKPTDLLNEDIDKRNKRLMDYLTNLLAQGRNETTVKNAYQGKIRSFYSSRGAQISDGLSTLELGLNHNQIYLDKNTIQKIYNKIKNENYKLLIKIQSLLGLRVSDAIDELTARKNGKAKYIIEKHKDHYFIRNFNTIKENIKIHFLLFPKELTRLIQTIYSIEDLTKLDLSNNFLKTRNNTLVNKNEYLRELKNRSKELKLGKVIRTHSFRKYFSTQISKIDLTKYNSKIGTDIEINFKEHLMGHKVHYSSNVYKQIIQNIDNFYNLWKPLEGALSIDFEIRDNTNEEIENLTEKYNKLIELDNQKDKRIAEMEAIVKNLSQLIIENEAILTSKLPDIILPENEQEQAKEMKRFQERADKIKEIEESLKRLTQN